MKHMSCFLQSIAPYKIKSTEEFTSSAFFYNELLFVLLAYKTTSLLEKVLPSTCIVMK